MIRSRMRAASPAPPPAEIPAICLTTPTPDVSAASDSFASVAPFAAMPLAPRADEVPKRRLVPKKSKLSLLGAKKEKGKDLSDVVRRVGAGSASSRGGFEIYVDPTDDPDMGEIVMVQRKKSRAALDGMRWAPGEVTNIPKAVQDKENKKPAQLSATSKEGSLKWWTMGRGRKDSKEKEQQQQGKEEKKKSKRSKTPDAKGSLMRPRFTSLDSGIILNAPMCDDPPMEQLFGLPPRPAPSINVLTHGSTPPATMAHSNKPFMAPSMSRADSNPTMPNPSLLAPPGMARAESQPGQPQGASGTGSIALRAMKSMKSLAHIGSWAQLKNGEGEVKKKEKKERRVKEGKEQAPRNMSQATTSSFEAGALSVRLSTSPEAVRQRKPSSTISGVPGEARVEKKKSVLGLGMGIGLGWPSTMRMAVSPAAPPTTPAGTIRLVQPTKEPEPESKVDANRLSVEQPAGSRMSFLSTLGRARAGSRSTVSSQSTAESLRPLSTSSYASNSSRPMSAMSTTSDRPPSCVSSAGSVKWDEERLVTVRERREKEKETKEKPRGSRSQRASGEGRKRASLADVFAGAQVQSQNEDGAEESEEDEEDGFPRVTVESATSDERSGHYSLDERDEEDEDGQRVIRLETPQKQRRPRAASEQMLSKARPAAISDGPEVVKSYLDQVTDDLASLIDRLDLEATPATPDVSPWRRSPGLLDSATSTAPESPTSTVALRNALKASGIDSPIKKSGFKVTSSITSLRPYAQTRATATTVPAPIVAPAKGRLGQQIAPWPVSPPKLRPVVIQQQQQQSNRRPAAIIDTPPGWRPNHRRTLSPVPALEPLPVFKPLRPFLATNKKSDTSHSANSSMSSNGDRSMDKLHSTPPINGHQHTRSRSSLTFGQAPSRIGNNLDDKSAESSPTPVFRKAKSSHDRKRSSLVALPLEQQSPKDSNGMPLAPDAKRGLGLAGTMGGSVASGMSVKSFNRAEPDSDVPDELQVILSGQSDEEQEETHNRLLVQLKRASTPLPSPGLPPQLPLPTPEPPLDLPGFQVTLADGHSCPSSPASPSDEDTKKSFDFTGEIMKLNESGASDRRSFVEQLESAFRTPAKVDLRGFGDFLAADDVPPVPKLPAFALEPSLMPADADTSDSSAGMHSAMHVDMTTTEEDESMDMHDDSIDQSRIFREIEGLVVEAELPNPLPSMEISRSRVSTEGSRSRASTMHSMRSKASDGQLDLNFKFGGKLSSSPSAIIPEDVSGGDHCLTLSDILPSPAQAQALSQHQETSVVEEDSEVLKSIYAKATALDDSNVRVRLESDTSSKRRARDMAMASLMGVGAKGHAKNQSEASFAGFDSFEEVRRGFEFGLNRPTFFPPQEARATKKTHGRDESLFSIASISSYGSVIRAGVPDPFGFKGPGTRPPSADMSISMSTVDDTFSFLNRDVPARTRVDSDASSFYFRPGNPNRNSQISARGHRRDESNFSIMSGPPISMYNRSFGHHRRNTSTSSSSVAFSYAMHGANGGRAAWARHHHQGSADSTGSSFSVARLGRPGVGDKMFDSMVMDHGPLSAISASPPGSIAGMSPKSSFDEAHYEASMQERASFEDSRYDMSSQQPASYDDSRFDVSSEQRSSSAESQYDSAPYDSLMDSYAPRSRTMEDSLFDKTGYRASMSEESLFMQRDPYATRGPPAYRPLSILSYGSPRAMPKEDDTMISMLGGGHVRRQSIGSVFEGSPCVAVERRIPKRPRAPMERLTFFPPAPSPKKTLVQQPSIASTSSSVRHFGDERMIKATHGLLNRQSLEESCLSGEGEDSTMSFAAQNSFRRPAPGSRSLSNAYASSGAETPPLSGADDSSEGGSMSSIDMSQLSIVLSNITHPLSGAAAARARARVRGRGHRRRITEARMSRSSVYETIQEEVQDPTQRLPVMPSLVNDSVYIVESDRDSVDWDDERDISNMRRYCALKHEAHETVEESKRTWMDTPFSVFAVQSFEPPNHPEGMQAMLSHSQQAYGPLPHELRVHRVRSRKNSARTSPYMSSYIQHHMGTEPMRTSPVMPAAQHNSAVLQQVPLNFVSPFAAAKNQVKKAAKRPASVLDENSFEKTGAAAARPRVNSSSRRAALGWAKRGSVKNDQKENSASQGIVNLPGSLRINRPRPRGRPTPARQTQIQTLRV